MVATDAVELRAARSLGSRLQLRSLTCGSRLRRAHATRLRGSWTGPYKGPGALLLLRLLPRDAGADDPRIRSSKPSPAQIPPPPPPPCRPCLAPTPVSAPSPSWRGRMSSAWASSTDPPSSPSSRPRNLKRRILVPPLTTKVWDARR